jgi:hypothetical protein
VLDRDDATLFRRAFGRRRYTSYRVKEVTPLGELRGCRRADALACCGSSTLADDRTRHLDRILLSYLSSSLRRRCRGGRSVSHRRNSSIAKRVRYHNRSIDFWHTRGAPISVLGSPPTAVLRRLRVRVIRVNRRAETATSPDGL